MKTKNPKSIGEQNFHQDGIDLAEVGYSIIPITQNTKVCQLKGWPDIDVNEGNRENTLDKWIADRRYNGWGVKTVNTPAIDLDIRDPEIVDKMVAYIREILDDGQILRRIGNAPKLLIPCKFEGDSFRKMNSAAYRDVEGNKHQIEFLGRGQYFVAYGIHPDTGKEYDWPDRDLMEFLPEELPSVNEEKIQDIFNKFESLVPSGWELESKNKSDKKYGKTKNGVVTKQEKINRNWRGQPAADVSTQRLREYLALIDPSPLHYDDWLEIGFALYHQYGGTMEGYDLWNEWSARSAKYLESNMEAKWQSMSVLPDGQRPITARYIVKMGMEKGGEVADGPMMDALDRYVLVGNATAGGQPGVVDKRVPPNVDPMTMKSFEMKLANVLVSVPSPTKKDTKVLKSLAAAWLQHPDRLTVDGLTYAPGQGRHVERNEQRLMNTFHRPIAAKTYDIDELAPFFELMENLFPDETEREWFLQWMAFTYKHPAERPHVTPLHIAPDTGTGRGTLVVILQKLLGKWNVKRTTMTDMMKGSYNEYLDRSTLVIVDEIGSGGNKYDAMAALNEVLTESDTNVNRKFGMKGTVDIYCNFLFLSNERDAISLPVNDRRMNVFMTERGKMSSEFYEELREWCGYTDRHGTTVGIENLRAYLNQMDLRNFDRARPIQNSARQQLIRQNMPSLELDFLDWHREGKTETVMTTQQIIASVAEFSGSDSFEMPTKQMGAIIRKYLDSIPGRVKINKAKYTVWYTAPGPEVKALRDKFKLGGVSVFRPYLVGQRFNADGSHKE